MPAPKTTQTDKGVVRQLTPVTGTNTADSGRIAAQNTYNKVVAHLEKIASGEQCNYGDVNAGKAKAATLLAQ